MLKKEQIVKLLGRPLTDLETSNYDVYIKIAVQSLEELLCMDLTQEIAERTYETRLGYREVYVDPFTQINSITCDGEDVDEADYTVKQFDKLNGQWYNIIEFESKCDGSKIVVDAEWGFGSCPTDLQLLLAKLFDKGSQDQKTEGTVSSKKIEDYSVTYKDVASFDEWLLKNHSIVDKYSLCNQGYIRHGSVRPIYEY